MATVNSALTTRPAEENGSDLGRTLQIKSAAFDLLAEEGLEGLTIRAVLKRTGLARRAFYERFAGKDDLVLAVFEDTLRRLADILAEKARADASPSETIRNFVFDVVMGELRHGERGIDRRGAAFSREHLRLAESRPAELQAALHPVLTLLAEQVAAGIRSGEFRDSDPQLQAALLYNVVSTTAHVEMLADEGRPDDGRRQRLAEEVWEFCRRAITV